jgi:hypothetical protein
LPVNEPQAILWTVYRVILIAVLLAGVDDFTLWFLGRETLSAFLRKEPLWFWIPVGITLLFLAGLALHLYTGDWELKGK